MTNCLHCQHYNPDHQSHCLNCERSMFWSYDPLIGKKLGNYRVLRKIGQGGCGSVYLAEHAYIGRKYAIKLLHPTHLDNPGMLERFQREAKVLSQLTHENILQFSDFGELDEGHYYLVTEYLEGKTLHQQLQKTGPVHPIVLAHMMEQLCAVLSHVHKHGVIHRDVKPSNIFFQARGKSAPLVKLIDFGIAGLQRSAEALTQQGEVLGTARYISPEQAAGNKEIDGRSDLYSLGIILARCLTGSFPFRGQTPVQTRELHLTQKAPTLSELAPDVHWVPELEEFVQSALAKDPAKRPNTADDFLRSFLEAFQAQQQLAWGETLHDSQAPVLSLRSPEAAQEAIEEGESSAPPQASDERTMLTPQPVEPQPDEVLEATSLTPPHAEAPQPPKRALIAPIATSMSAPQGPLRGRVHLIHPPAVSEGEEQVVFSAQEESRPKSTLLSSRQLAWLLMAAGCLLTLLPFAI